MVVCRAAFKFQETPASAQRRMHNKARGRAKVSRGVMTCQGGLCRAFPSIYDSSRGSSQLFPFLPCGLTAAYD